jgi:hypothetical protein
MKAGGWRISFQILGLVLILLAVSPVTAPFLTFGLGCVPGQTDSSAIQAKKAPADSAAAVFGAAILHLADAGLDAPMPVRVMPIRACKPAHVPLRI